MLCADRHADMRHGPNALRAFLIFSFAVQVDQIDGESHEESVHRFARSDPQSFAGRKALPAQQPFSAFCSCVCGLKPRRQHRSARHVRELAAVPAVPPARAAK
jgi:hypothetical protein